MHRVYVLTMHMHLLQRCQKPVSLPQCLQLHPLPPLAQPAHFLSCYQSVTAYSSQQSSVPDASFLKKIKEQVVEEHVNTQSKSSTFACKHEISCMILQGPNNVPQQAETALRSLQQLNYTVSSLKNQTLPQIKKSSL